MFPLNCILSYYSERSEHRLFLITFARQGVRLKRCALKKACARKSVRLKRRALNKSIYIKSKKWFRKSDKENVLKRWIIFVEKNTLFHDTQRFLSKRHFYWGYHVPPQQLLSKQSTTPWFCLVPSMLRKEKCTLDHSRTPIFGHTSCSFFFKKQ